MNKAAAKMVSGRPTAAGHGKVVLTVFLALAMILSLLPATALPASADVTGKTLVSKEDLAEYGSVSYQRGSVHDPSIIEAADGSFYVFGSHMNVAKTGDLMNWSRVAIDGEDAPNGYYGRLVDGEVQVCNYEDAFTQNALTGETTLYKADDTTYTVNFADYDISSWHYYEGTGDGNSKTIRGNQWAPDIIYNREMGKYCLYQSINGGHWNSAVVLLTSDNIEGPYVYQAPIVFTGFQSVNDDPSRNRSWKSTDLALALAAQGIEVGETLPERYEAGNSWGDIWPHAIDPCVTYDEDGNLFLAYGSWSGGIYVLEMDEMTGLRDYSVSYSSDFDANNKGAVTSDPYFGQKIAGGYYVSGEGSYIEKIGKYWYLFMSYGFYSPEGGYEMRVFRSERPDGPYVDQNGESAIFGQYLMNYGPDSKTDRGQKLITGYRWQYMNVGETAQGHNSAIQLANGRAFLICHTKFADGTAAHQLRVHELYVTKEGWLAASPLEYGGDTSSDFEELAASEIAGTYEIIPGSYRLKYSALEVVESTEVELTADGKVLADGQEAGSWSGDGKYATIIYNGNTYSGGFIRQKRMDTGAKTVAFTGNCMAGSSQGANFWAVKSADDRFAVLQNMESSLPIGTSVDISLGTEAAYGAEISWSSSNPEALTAEGKVTRAANDVTVNMTRTVVKGDYYYESTQPVIVYGTDGENASRMIDYGPIAAGTALPVLSTVSKDTGVCLSFREAGLTSDWTTIFRSDRINIYLSVLNYGGTNIFEAAAEVSEYAQSLGYSPENAWKMFTDGGTYDVKIDYKVDGSIDFYRDGEKMMTYKSDTAIGSSTVKYAAKGIADAFGKGEFTVSYGLENLSIGYASDYVPGEIEEPVEKEVIATVGTDNGDGSYSLPWNVYTNFFRMDAPEGDFEATVSFHQDSEMANNWNSYAVAVTADLAAEIPSSMDWYLRSDVWNNFTFNEGGSENKLVKLFSNVDFNTFRDDMKDADVDLTVKRVGSDMIITADIFTSTGKSFQITALSADSPTGPLAVYLGGEACLLKIYEATMDALTLSREAGEDVIATVGTKNDDGSYSLTWDDYDNFYGFDSLENDFEAVFIFDNASLGINQWDSFALAALSEGGYTWHARCDAWSPDGLTVPQYVNTVDGDWEGFKTANKNSRVWMEVTRSGGMVSYIAHVAGENGSVYELAGASYSEDDSPLRLLIGGESCQLNILGAGNKAIERTPVMLSAETETPEAQTDLVYDGTAQELVSGGAAYGGVIGYALGSDAENAPAEGYAAEIPTATDAGTYYVWHKVLGDANHRDTAAEVIAVTIAPKAITVKANDVTKNFGADDPELTYVSEGLIDGDSFTGSLARDAGEAAGTYAIKLGTLAAGDNYVINFTGAKFTIYPAATVETMGGANTEDSGVNWVAGSGRTLEFRFSRPIDDEFTIEHFRGIKVDGAEVDKSAYTVRKGSVIVTLNPSYLQSLADGEHTLAAMFDDSGDVEVQFNVVAAAPAPADSSKAVLAPATGESVPISFFAGLMMLAAAAWAYLVGIKQRQ
ncbi:MAG: family 43 glycosylhydrolase [Lachnospiraceae bacterium]|nr:family 43 glycosylhydrolase [Lachnospiraceae bacterium]